jgi:hypothetical protein
MAAQPSLRNKIRALKVFPEPWGCVPDPPWRNPKVKNFFATIQKSEDLREIPLRKMTDPSSEMTDPSLFVLFSQRIERISLKKFEGANPGHPASRVLYSTATG